MVLKAPRIAYPAFHRLPVYAWSSVLIRAVGWSGQKRMKTSFLLRITYVSLIDTLVYIYIPYIKKYISYVNMSQIYIFIYIYIIYIYIICKYFVQIYIIYLYMILSYMVSCFVFLPPAGMGPQVPPPSLLFASYWQHF